MGDSEDGQRAPHQGLGLNIFKCSTGPARPILGGPGKGRNARDLVRRACSPQSQGQVAPVGGSFPEQNPKNQNKQKHNKKPDSSPYSPKKFLSAILDTFFKVRGGTWGRRKKSFGASSDQTKRDSTLRPRPFPALARGLGLTPLPSPRPPQRGPETP